MCTKNKYQTLKDPKAKPHLWVEHYADYLFAYACLRINDKELAKDLVQETFLGALEGLEKFDKRCSEKTWLTAILKNKIYDVYRKSSCPNGQSLLLEDDSESEELFEPDTGHFKQKHFPVNFAAEQPDAVQDAEFQRILLAGLKKMPLLWMSAFTMKHIDEESTKTICTELQLTPSHFWVIMHRSKLHLRSYLQQNWI